MSAMKKKILFVIDSLGCGGAERVVLTLSRALMALGHQVHIVIINNVIEHKIDFDVNIHSLQFKKKRFERTYTKYSKALKDLIVQLENNRGKFDLILSNLGISDRLLSMINMTNVYYIIHTIISSGSLGSRKGLRLFLKKRKIKKMYDHKNIITITDEMADDLITNVGVIPKSVQTIYNPFDVEWIRKLSLSNCNPYSNEDYIVHVARFVPLKRHDLLLKAYALSQVNEKLILLGDGPLVDNMKSLASELNISSKVIFAGFMKNPYPIIRDAKLSVLSSDYEGLPSVIIESLILKTPVVSTDCPSGPKEIMIGELSAFLSKVNDEADLADKILLALNRYKDKRQIDFSIYIEKFEATDIAQKYLNLCKI